VLDWPLWGNARNRVFRLTTDMRTTQGQASFGQNVQTIITYSKRFKYSQTGGTVGRAFSIRIERIYIRVLTLINKILLFILISTIFQQG
jgi:hypothetical protein